MELKDYLRIVRRRIWWFLGIFGIIVGGFLLTAVLSVQRIYTARTELVAQQTAMSSLFSGILVYFPNVGKMNPEARVESLKRKEVRDLAALYLCDAKDPQGRYLFPEERARADEAAETCREEFLKIQKEAHPDLSEAEILEANREKLERLLEDRRILDPSTGRWTGVSGKREQALMEGISSSISGMYGVEQFSEKLQMVGITVTADSPAKAVEIANAIANAAIAYNIEFDQRELAQGLVRARARIGENDRRLAEVRAQLKDYWKAHNISQNEFFTSTTFYQQIDSLQRDIDRLHDELSRKDETEMRIEEQHKLDLEQFPEFVIPKDSALNQLLLQRSIEEQNLENLLTKYTESHPEVKRTRQSIGELRQQFDVALVKFKENDARNFRRDKAVLNLERAYLRAEIERKRKSLDALNARRIEVDQLKVDERSLTNLLQHLEEANKRMTDFITSAELYADAAARPLDRFQLAPLDPERDWTMEQTDPFRTVWFVAVVAFLISIGAVCLIEYMDTTLKTEQDIRRHLNLPVLGVIPKQREPESVLLSELPTKCDFAEQFYTAATILRSSAQELNLKTLVVSSTIPKEGKTTVTLNLGIALARKGFKVLLVDADMRIPQLHEVLGVPNHFGLSSILEGRLKAKEILSEIRESAEKMSLDQCILDTVEENLKVIPSGPCPSDPLSLVESVRMKALIEELKAKADFVFFDTPPVTSVCDALPLAESCDAVLFVVGAGGVEQHQATRAKHLLSGVEASMLGCILNHAFIDGESYYYYYNEYKSYRSRA